MEKARAGCDGYRTKETKLKTEMLCGLASWREKFMGQLRVADVSRKGAKARRRFPGLASWLWILRADDGLFRGRRDADGFPDVPLSQFSAFRFPNFCFSAFIAPFPSPPVAVHPNPSQWRFQ